MISFCGWISDRCSFTIPAPSSRYNMPIWLRSHRDGVTHDMLWFAQFIFRCCFQYHLFKPYISKKSHLIIFNESFKNINPQMFWTLQSDGTTRKNPSEIRGPSANGQVVLWRFGLCDPGGPVSHWPVATDQVRAHAEHHQGREGHGRWEVQKFFLGFDWT